MSSVQQKNWGFGVSLVVILVLGIWGIIEVSTRLYPLPPIMPVHAVTIPDCLTGRLISLSGTPTTTVAVGKWTVRLGSLVELKEGKELWWCALIHRPVMQEPHCLLVRLVTSASISGTAQVDRGITELGALVAHVHDPNDVDYPATRFCLQALRPLTSKPTTEVTTR